MKNNLLLLLVLCTMTSLLAQDNKKDKWKVNQPPFDYKTIDINTDEGTWMNVDISPDGQQVAFDLLGDIYTMPITGGKAQAIRTGIAWEIQPRWSPDGKQILFTSDAGGGDNIWVMDADGQSAQQLTKESFRLLNNATWTPDGNYFVARKHFTSQRSLGAGEMWIYHKTGGAGQQLTQRKNDQQDVNEPSVSPDGRYVYFSEDMYPGGYFQYNKDPNSQIYVIKRYDREKGEVSTITGGPGGACRPQISHDGKKLAYVHRIRTRSVLMIHDLETGEEVVLFDGLSKDQQEAWAIFGAYTGFDWMPDDSAIVIWAQGKLHRIDARTGVAKVIPFEVSAKHQVAAETVKVSQRVHQDQFTAKVIRHAVTAPDGKSIVFSALGQLYIKKLPDGTPRRLTKSTDFEFEPAFSPDGRQLVYVSWDDETMGTVRVLDLNNSKSKKITNAKGIYRTPAFSPDGQQIVFRKDGGNTHQGYTHSKQPGIYTILAKGGAPQLVRPNGEYPVFSKDGQRIFYQTGGFLFGSLTKAYHSCALDGTDDRKHADGKYAQRFAISPDNQWIAWSELYKVYLAPMPLHGKPVGLSKDTKAVPVAQVAKDAGINIHFSADSKKLHWTLGEEYFTDNLTERFLFLEQAAGSIPPLDTTGIRIGLDVKTDRPTGMIAFTNAQIITMEADQVIESGTIVIENNKIVAIGQSEEVAIPKKAK
ncbi:MAG: amidohydrolase, partial [Bacteroidota bacterium]